MPPKTSKSPGSLGSQANPGAKVSPGDSPWRSRAPLIAAFVGVGVVGVAIGRASSPVRESPAPPAVAPSTSVASEGSVEPQRFDVTDNPRGGAGIPLRPMDRDIFALITSMKLDRTQMHDVFPDRPYRVSFVGSVAEHRVGLVMIDLDRDGKFEERWDLKREGVVRLVQRDPSADGAPVSYSLAHGRWMPH